MKLMLILTLLSSVDICLQGFAQSNTQFAIKPCRNMERVGGIPECDSFFRSIDLKTDTFITFDNNEHVVLAGSILNYEGKVRWVWFNYYFGEKDLPFHHSCKVGGYVYRLLQDLTTFVKGVHVYRINVDTILLNVIPNTVTKDSVIHQKYLLCKKKIIIPPDKKIYFSANITTHFMVLRNNFRWGNKKRCFVNLRVTLYAIGLDMPNHLKRKIKKWDKKYIVP